MGAAVHLSFDHLDAVDMALRRPACRWHGRPARRPACFASTNLDFNLRGKGITTIAPGGFLTNCCVESTMRTGYENGYRVVTLTDCLAATSPEEHDNALKDDFPMFSQPMSSAEFIAGLGG